MANIKTDPEREQRIAEEIVVDAHDECERAMGWHCYLKDHLEFPFTASCAAKREISPLQIGDDVHVTGMADEDECAHEIFVMIRWERDGLGVPLSQLRPVDAYDETRQAVKDWHYWVRKGYRF